MHVGGDVAKKNFTSPLCGCWQFKLELLTDLLSSLLLYGRNTTPLFDQYHVAVFYSIKASYR